jgi:hypothetical protein
MIPSHIKVSKVWYRVNLKPQTRSNFDGYIQYVPRQIYVFTHRKDGAPIKPVLQRETFWHETVHAILYEMQHPLYNNEKFVTEFAKNLSKVIDTARFEHE